MIFKGQIFNVVSCGNYWKNKKKWQRGKLSVYHFRNTIIFFSQSCCFRRDCKANVCVMARCITYFTMLLELLIIKNVKCVGVMFDGLRPPSAPWRVIGSFGGDSSSVLNDVRRPVTMNCALTGNTSKLGSNVTHLCCWFMTRCKFFKKSAPVWLCSKWRTLTCFDALMLAQNDDVQNKRCWFLLWVDWPRRF